MSDLSYYNAQEKHWVSPRLVLVYFEDLRKKYGDGALKSSKFKKVQEARTVAIQLLGHYAHDGKHYYMQVPKDINESPDIVTMYRRPPTESERGVQMMLQDIEVVDYDNNSKEGIDQFLLKKKLFTPIALKAYDEKTTILCHVKKAGARVKAAEIYETIQKVNPKCHVLILQEIGRGNYKLIQVWPTIGDITFNLTNVAINYPKGDSILLTLGTEREIITTKTNLRLPSIDEVFELSNQ